MTQRRRMWACAVFVVALLAAIGIQFVQLNDYRWRLEMAFRQTAKPSLEKLDPLELRAVAEWATLLGITREAAIKDRDVRTLPMGAQTCIVLLLERGSLGVSPTYCFDKADKLVGRYNEVE